MKNKYCMFLGICIITVLVSILLCCHPSPFAIAQNTNKNQEKHILATVNGETITLDDYNEQYRNMPPHLQENMQNPTMIKQYLEKMIEQKLLEQEAIQLGLNNDPALIKQLQDFQSKLLINVLRRKIMAENIKDERIESYYKKHLSRYSHEYVSASHILVKTEEEAKNILKQLSAGKSFQDLAKRYSIDPTSKKGGDLGNIPRGKMAPEFEKALFTMKKKGEISPIVKTRFGYHIIKLTGTLQKQVDPLNKVKNKIKRELEKEVMEKYLEQLKARAKLTVAKEYQ